MLWKKLKKNNNNDDSNVILEKNKTNNEISQPVKKPRNSSFDKKKETKKVEMFADNTEQNTGDIPEVDEPVVPLTYKETEELLKDPKFAKVKELKQHTDTEFSRTVLDKNKGHSNIVKSLVSQDKTRFCYDGFDLDLTYITMRIIAMGFPSSAIEGIYRNSMEDVKEFFAKRHPNHYKVYNLCDDKKYAKDCFYRQGWFPFKDHEAPPLNLIRPFCEDAKKFLDEDEKNVVSIHCKAGKGRTGTFICCLLLYLNFFETAEECLLYYGLMRVGTVKGVTVPSQIRYVHYFESILKNKIPHPITFKKIIIRKVKMYTIPKVGKKKFTPNFTIENQGKIVKYSDINKKKDSYTVTNYDLPFIEFPMGIAGHAVSGDVKFTFFQVQLLQILKSDKLFKFWFNTNFLPAGGLYEIKKEGIDKACKDKKCKVYKEDFKIEIEYIYN
jgi:phosphatidylinositol-3,4,5-trisphosphate 3-phosphatase/dual-specificity protein phosphatase PTEN